MNFVIYGCGAKIGGTVPNIEDFLTKSGSFVSLDYVAGTFVIRAKQRWARPNHFVENDTLYLVDSNLRLR